MLPIFDWLLRVFSEGLNASERAKLGAALWRMVVAAHIIWAWGVFPDSGFATAEEVDKTIDAKLKPFIDKLAVAVNELEKTVEANRRQLVRESAAKIRRLQKVCMALPEGSAARGTASEEIEFAQMEYRELTGHEYPVAIRCE